MFVKILNVCKWLFIIVITGFGMVSKLVVAQHCEYDFQRLFGVVPFSGDTQNLVKGLTIQLVFHTKDLPILPNQVEDLHYNPVFNIPTTKHPGYFERKTLIQGGVFEFTQNHYSVDFHSRQSNPRLYYILVQDTDGVKNGGDFGTRVIELNSTGTTKQVSMSLCGSTKNKMNPMQSYEPIFIDLDQILNKSASKEDCGTQFEQWIFKEDTWLVQTRKNRCSQMYYSYVKQSEIDIVGKRNLGSNGSNKAVNNLNSGTNGSNSDNKTTESPKNKWICVKEQHCYHVFPNSERIDCVVSELKNGQWVESQRIHGCE